jgi:translin
VNGAPDTSPLGEVIPRIIDHLTEVNAARETALHACRKLIQASARSIRAVHRGEFDDAKALLDNAREEADQALEPLMAFGDIYYAGFVRDALKEYVEARTTLALSSGGTIPTPEDLGVDFPAYLNGIAEAVGELRRLILDRLRAGQFEGSEALLDAMDEIYSALVTVDFPDAMTGGLRRTTDQTRGILERTRGDLTTAIVQRNAMRSLPGHEE